MKKILLLSAVILTSISAFSQKWLDDATYGSRRQGISAKRVVMIPTGCGNPATLNLKDSSENMAAEYFDSCNHRKWIYDPKLKAWDSIHVGIVSASGSGGGTDNTNTGSYYRILVPSSQALKTLAPGFATDIDSTSLPGALLLKVDSATLFTYMKGFIRDTMNASSIYWRSNFGAGNDSLIVFPNDSTIVTKDIYYGWGVTKDIAHSNDSTAAFMVDSTIVESRAHALNSFNILNASKVDRLYFSGEIVNQSTWGSLTGWTANGATVTLSGGYPQISAPAYDCQHTFDYNYVTGAEYWSIRSRIKIQSADAMPSVGIRQLRSTMGVMGRIIQQSGTSYYVDIIGNCGSTTVRCDSLITVNVNDVLDFLFERDGNIFSLTVRNITTGGQPYTVSYAYNTVVDILPTTGRPAVFAYTGSYELQYFRFSNRTVKNVGLVAVTDSKFAPYGSSYNGGSFQQIAKTNSVILSTNPNDRTNEVKQKLPELLSFGAKQYFISIGSNNIRDGSSVASVIADIDSISTVLRAAGGEVYISNGTYESSVDLSALKDAINARYSVDSVIDAWTPSLTPGFLHTDGVHISEYGQKLMYDLLISSFKFNRPQYQLRLTEKSFINNSTAQQTGNFNVSGESTVANTLNIGKSTVTIPLKVFHPSGSLQIVGYGGYSNLRAYNSGATAYANMMLTGASTIINTASGLTEYEGLTINRDVSRFGGGLVVGNQYSLSNTEALGVNVGNSAYTSLLNFSGTNYLQFINAYGGNNGTPLNMRASSYSLNSFTSGVATLNIFAQDGKVGIATGSPSAVLHIAAGTNTVAPLKLSSGTNLTTPENGAIEYDGTHLYFTTGGTRTQLENQSSGSGLNFKKVFAITQMRL